ncbi:MAG: zinc ribbon domain-containing protein [Paludibacter sp.]
MAYCSNCGNKLSENDRFCEKCGQIVDSQISLNSQRDKTFESDNQDQKFSQTSPNKSLSSILQKLNNKNSIILFLSLFVLLFNSIIIFYLLLHPGLILMPMGDFLYYFVSDTKIFNIILVALGCISFFLNLKTIYIPIVNLLNIIYVIGIYYVPNNYICFFENSNYSITEEAWIYSILLIILNTVSIILLIVNKNKRQNLYSGGINKNIKKGDSNIHKESPIKPKDSGGLR